MDNIHYIERILYDLYHNNLERRYEVIHPTALAFIKSDNALSKTGLYEAVEEYVSEHGFSSSEPFDEKSKDYINFKLFVEAYERLDSINAEFTIDDRRINEYFGEHGAVDPALSCFC